MSNLLQNAEESGTTIARTLKTRISFFLGNEALGSAMSQVNRERVQTGNGIDGYNLEQAILAERDMTEEWADLYCPDRDEETAPVDHEARWGGWMTIIKGYMAEGIAPPNFNRALQFRRTNAYSDDYTRDIENMRKVCEASGMPFVEADARALAIENRKGLREWVDRNGEEAVSRCIDALNPNVEMDYDEPEDFDDIVVKAHKSAKSFAWKGAMKGIESALSDLGMLTALES